MILEMHLPFQDNSSTRRIVRARDLFVQLVLTEAAPIGMSLKRTFTTLNYQMASWLLFLAGLVAAFRSACQNLPLL
jgi:hypothetical protein